MLWVWLSVIIVAVFLEIITQVQLVSVWAAVGGLIALISYLCGANEIIQIIIFFVVTIVSIILTRPLVKKLTKFKKSATNADMNVGKTGKVIKIINETDGIFQVKVSGCEWSAVTEDKNILPIGSDVTVKSIEGVKLIVVPLKQTIKV